MSDLYEFEDTIWDEFCQSDDHIVPHPFYKRADDHSILGDSLKKTRRKVTRISNSNEDSYNAGYLDQGREYWEFSSLSKRRNTMLEKDSWSDSPSAVFPPPSDDDSIKEASSLASDNTTSSSHAFKSSITDSNSNESAKDAILGDKAPAVGNNSFSYPLGDINHTGNNLAFSENTEEKDSSDFLYYGWPEIGNFEDFDRMFGSCDSSFGLGAGKEDELGWFSSVDNVGGCEDMVKSDIKFSCPESKAVENISQNDDSSKGYSVNDPATRSAPVGCKDGSWTSDSFMSFVSGPAVPNGEDEPIPKEPMNDRKGEVKVQNQPLRKRKEHHYMSSGSVSCISNLPNEVVQLPSGATVYQAHSSVRMQEHHHEHTLSPDSCNYLQNHHSHLHSENNPLYDLGSVNPTPPDVKSETIDFSSPSSRDSNRASNQLQSTESSHGPPSPATAPEGSGQRQKQFDHPSSRSSVNSSLENGSSIVPGAMGDPGSIGKQVYYPGDKSENHSGVEGVSGVVPPELGTSNMLESSTVSPAMDDISLEAASFQQLQIVTEQMDLRTKICIRDSLYRLARSAEQRHKHANLNGSCGDERDPSRAFMAEGANNFADMETDTNPIDRSIAHLLFHRPSETPSVVRGSVTSASPMVENSVTCEVAAEIDKATDG